MTNWKTTAKAIVIGGFSGGFLSLIPFINLLNLLFLSLIISGGAICVYYLIRENGPLPLSEALVSGAASGLLAGAIFIIATRATISNIPPDKIEQMIAFAQAVMPSAQEQLLDFFGQENFQSNLRTATRVLIFLSALAGASGGMIYRTVYKRKAG